MRKLLFLFLVLFSLACLSRADLSRKVPFVGTGINSNGQFLPKDRLKALGVRWVRVDLSQRDLTAEKVKALLFWYKDFPVLWILNNVKDGAGLARKLVSWGVRDLEVGNEPELGKYNYDLRAWSPSAYARWYASVAKAVGSKCRLYGPSTATWLPDYVEQTLKELRGLKVKMPDGVSFHGYGPNPFEVMETGAKVIRSWGLVPVVTEVSCSPNDDAARWFLALQMGVQVPYCWYRGPAEEEAPDKMGRGFFTWDGGAWSGVTPVFSQAVQGRVNPPSK